MNIVVIGSGAIGLLTAKLLEDEGHHVIVIARTEREGPMLYQTVAGDTQLLSLQLTTDMSELNHAELVIVAVKAYDLEPLLPSLQHVRCPILFLQNGLVRELVETYVASDRVLIGSTDHAAKLTDDLLIHTGMGSIQIGGQDALNYLAKALHPVMKWNSNMERVVIRKALLNTLINPLTALMNVSNGKLWKDRDLQQAVISHYDELMMNFPEFEELVSLEEVFELIRATATNSSSMRNDVLKGKRTEIDYIVLPFIQRAEEKGCFLPITSYIYFLIQSKRGVSHSTTD